MFNTTIPESINFQEFIYQQNQEDLFQWYLGINVSNKFRNPFRNDLSPGCYLEYSNGLLLMWDWGNSNFKGKSIVQIISYTKGISYREAVYYILTNYKNVNVSSPCITRKRDSSFLKQIYPTKRNWNIFDKEYWSEYGITRSNLDYEGVIPVDWYYTNFKSEPDRLQSIVSKHLTYAIPIKSRWKIYVPSIKLFDTNQKWDDIGGISPFTDYEILIVTKSYKDYQVLTNLGYSCRYILCETVSINPKFIKYVAKEFDFIFFLMDNDLEGIKATERLVNDSNFITDNEYESKFIGVTLPEYLLEKGISDSADYYKAFGEYSLQNLLN